MVKGLEVFRDYFAGQADQFVFIGGTAATLAMADAGLAFRATKDLDIVLHIEALTSEFGVTFWSFAEMGGYEFRQTSDTGLPWVGADRLIPLKARAWLDLTARKADGEGGRRQEHPQACQRHNAVVSITRARWNRTAQ
jgi:hypothetical protein